MNKLQIYCPKCKEKNYARFEDAEYNLGSKTEVVCHACDQEFICTIESRPPSNLGLGRGFDGDWSD
jgi:hypothetical protein